MTRSKRAMALLFFCGLLATPALAQDPVEIKRHSINGDELYHLDFSETQLPDLIEAISKLTGKSFLYDERVRGTVSLITDPDSPGVTADELYQIFESILQVKGFTTVPAPGGVVKIVPTRDAKQAPIETTRGSEPPPNRDLYITRLVPLRYVRAEDLQNTFRQLISPEAALIAYAPTNTLIVTDTMASIRRLLTIVAEIDVESHREQIKVIPLEFADATELVTHLESIFGEQGSGRRGQPGSSVRRARNTAAQAQAAVAPAVTNIEGFEGGSSEPRFIADDRTNAIIVIAARGVMSEIEKLVQLLDYKRSGAGRIHVVRLQNADAEEMAQTLASLTGGGGGGGASTASRVAGQAGAAVTQSAVAELEGGVKVTADAPTNSLIIQASAEGFAAVNDVVQALDIRRPQVMVEALIMEVNVNDNLNLSAGLILNTLFGTTCSSANPAACDPVVGSFNFGGGSIGSAVGDAFGGAATGNFLGALLGKTITILDPNDPTQTIEVPVIQGILNASAGNKDTNVISSPTILTADNEEAQIVVGSNIPIPVSQVQTPTTGGSTGDFNVQNQIERRDVGVTLRVTPQISEGDTVRLDIFQEISEVDRTVSNEDGPETTNRQVENTVYVRDSEAVMIGGIIQEKLTNDDTKIPWLGDIPILGWLFRSTAEQVSKTNLIIILTPHIVRDPEDLQRLTVEHREQFRNSAGEALDWDEEDEEERRKAMAAGMDLPRDVNPVRRELEVHTHGYPTEELPTLQKRHREREEERQGDMERTLLMTGGSYVVQVSVFRTSKEAVELLTSLIGKGYDGTVLARREGDDVAHIVQLGPYLTADRAQFVAREVGTETGHDAQVIVEQ